MENVMCSNNLFLKGKKSSSNFCWHVTVSKNDKTILASFLSLRTTNMLGRFRFKLFGNFNQRLQVQKRLSFLFLPEYFCRMTEQLGGAEEGNQWPYFFRCKSLPWLLWFRKKAPKEVFFQLKAILRGHSSFQEEHCCSLCLCSALTERIELSSNVAWPSDGEAKMNSSNLK